MVTYRVWTFWAKADRVSPTAPTMAPATVTDLQPYLFTKAEDIGPDNTKQHLYFKYFILSSKKTNKKGIK